MLMFRLIKSIAWSVAGRCDKSWLAGPGPAAVPAKPAAHKL